MAQTYNKMKIDIKEPVTDIITAKQNDSNSRFLDVYLYDGGVPIDLTGHEVRIYMLKADGTEVFNNGEITNATAGRCQFELTDQALGAYGKLQCEITLWKDNVQILTTPTFDIFVVKNLRTNGSIESSNEYGALVVLYQNLYEAIDLMTTMVEQFGEPGEVADAASIETFWQMLEYLYDVNEAALQNASVSEVLNRIGLNTDGEDAGTLFGTVNPLKEYINEILDTKIKNHFYRSDDYCTISSPSTRTIISSEKSVKGNGSSDNYKALLLGTFVIPDNTYDITITANLKSSSASGTPHVYIFYSDSINDGTNQTTVDSVGRVTGGSKTSYAEYTVTLDITKVIPGKTLQFYMYTGANTYTYYCNSLKVVTKTFNRVVTSEKYLIGSEKTISNIKITTSGTVVHLTQLPRHDRTKVIMGGNLAIQSYYPAIVMVDGVEYVYSVLTSTILKVNY